jgi:Helix-turn-helix domain
VTSLAVQLEAGQLAELADMIAERVIAAGQHANPAVETGWMTTREAAAYLKMHPSEVQRAARTTDGIPYEQEASGCALYFRAAELDKWVQAGKPGHRRHR